MLACSGLSPALLSCRGRPRLVTWHCVRLLQVRSSEPFASAMWESFSLVCRGAMGGQGAFVMPPHSSNSVRPPPLTSVARGDRILPAP
eukprot:14208294-Alexandrium_andersonii.AAC.1